MCKTCSNTLHCTTAGARPADQRPTAEANMNTIVCGTCNVAKVQCEYPKSIWHRRSNPLKVHIRCKTCLKCPGCPATTLKRKLSDFECGALLCQTCSKTLCFVVCGEYKKATDYFYDTVWRHRHKQLHHRCKAFFTCPTCPTGTQHKLTDFAFGDSKCKTCTVVVCSGCQKKVRKSTCNFSRNW